MLKYFSRYNEGKAFMPDDEFDALRKQLKKKGSYAVMHEVVLLGLITQLLTRTFSDLCLGRSR